jgi:molybdopterin converting factor small subunit
MLKSAAANYEINGDAEQASQIVEPLLSILAKDSQYYQQVAQKIKDWEDEEEQNKSLLDEVRAELEKEKPNWNLAYSKANEVTTSSYKKKAQPLKDQAFHGNNKDRLERAKASYNQGNLKGAIDIAKQIPYNANVYSDATQLLSKWRSELSKLEADIQRFLKHYSTVKLRGNRSALVSNSKFLRYTYLSSHHGTKSSLKLCLIL